MIYTKFAWLPVPLAVCEMLQWRMTGKKAWLRRVRVVKTVWGDTFYVAIP